MIKNISKLNEIKIQLSNAENSLQQNELENVRDILKNSKISLDDIINSFEDSEKKKKSTR